MPKTKQHKPMPKPWLVLFIGDTHIMGDTSLCIPKYIIGTKEQRPYSASASQVWLYKSFQNLISQVKEKSKDYRIAVHFGGDITDGVNHHGTTQTQGTAFDQISMAVTLLMPLMNIADYAAGVTGTEAHVGPQGSNDWTIYHELGIRVIGPHFEMEYEGRRLMWRHHGVRVGSREWGDSNPMFLMAKDIAYYSIRRGQPIPDLLVAHDQHRMPKPVSAEGVTVAVCGCWQLSTYFGDTISFKQPDIGVLWWEPRSNRIERIRYEQSETVKRIS